MVDSIVPVAPPLTQRAGLTMLHSKGGCAVLRSTRGVALLTLALINVFAWAAGVILVRVRPVRLAMLKPVQVASRADVQASPVLGDPAGAALPTSSGLDGT